jgi:cytochrome c oxidase subunit 2
VSWLTNPASLQGLTMRGNWYVFLAAATVVAIVVYGCILWCVLAYSRRSRDGAATFSGNPRLEILYTAIPLAMVAGLFAVTFVAEVPIDRVSAHPQDRVAVTAFRWSWQFEYPGSGITVSGTPRRMPTLYLPVNRTTEIDLTTADVNHSFWVPAFLFKRDAIPGMTNKFDLTPNRTGRFLSRCAQFCGLDHALMTFQVAVVPDDAYDRYLASHGTALP